MISIKDKERLRALAAKRMEYASNAENDRILKMWRALSEGKREAPTVRLLFSNFMDEVVDNRLVCEDRQARSVERQLVAALSGANFLWMIRRSRRIFPFRGAHASRCSECSR